MALTSLVGGDVHGDMLRWEWAFVGNSIDSLDLKGIWRMGPQVADKDPGFREAQLPWHKLHIVITAGAATAVRPTLLADNVVGHIITTSRLPGWVPF